MSAPNIVANESQMSHRFTDTYNPQSGRGRKPSNGSASSRRAEQNRIHQRTLRERKEAYVKGLNAKIEELTSLLVPNALFVEYERLKKRVSDLEMELSSTRSNLSDISKSPPECSNCAAERFKNAILTEKVSGLNRQLSDLKATKAPSPQPPAPSDLPPLEFIDPMMMDFSAISDDWMEALLRDIEQPRQLLKSAEELYGPLEVLSCGIAFKGIPYIKNSKMDIVDRLGLLLTAQSQSNSPERILAHQMQISTLTQRMVSGCSVIERQKVIEALSVFFERNKKQTVYMMQLSHKAPVMMERPPLAVNLPPEAIRLKEIAKSIPSLKGSEELVNEICGVFWNDSKMYKETLLYMNVLSYKLQKTICDAEDMEKWMMAFEAAKLANQSRMDELLTEGMKALDIWE